jgi:hypothetical protein
MRPALIAEVFARELRGLRWFLNSTVVWLSPGAREHPGFFVLNLREERPV